MDIGYARYLPVLEQIRTKLNLIIARQRTNTRRMDRLDRRLRSFERRLVRRFDGLRGHPLALMGAPGGGRPRQAAGRTARR